VVIASDSNSAVPTTVWETAVALNERMARGEPSPHRKQLVVTTPVVTIAEFAG